MIFSITPPSYPIKTDCSGNTASVVATTAEQSVS